MANRARRREADRALVAAGVSQRLGIPRADIARAMRVAGVAGPLTVHLVQRWADDPEWLSGLRADRMARAAQQEYHREQQREQQEMRELAAEQSARGKVKAGQRYFSEAERFFVEDWAFEAAKDLVRDGPGAKTGDFACQVLRAVGVDSENHATWPVHAGGCDGEGRLHCADRIEEVRAGRRAVALTESVAREVALREAAFSPGQTVVIWSGARAGMVVKVNKVSVKVRFTGGIRDRYAPVERNLDPRYVHHASESLPVPPLPGEEVVIRDHGSHVRQARVTEVDGPLFEVAYSLKSGQWRSAWFDVLALLPGLELAGANGTGSPAEASQVQD